MLKAYLDESYGNHVFTLGGWLGQANELDRLGSQWKKRIDFDNRRLERQGRRVLTRYHASDCSSRQNEYEGWTVAEQIEHAKALLEVIVRRKMLAIGCSVSISDLLEVYPENSHDSIQQAYYLCLKNLMVQLGHIMRRFAPDEKITIFHDWTDHNAGILTAFEATVGVQGWISRKFYTTIAPLHWQDCVQLQPADLIAYEIYKATEAQRHTGRKMRRFLRELLGNKAQIAAKYFPKSVLEKIRNLPLKTE